MTTTNTDTDLVFPPYARNDTDAVMSAFQARLDAVAALGARGRRLLEACRTEGDVTVTQHRDGTASVTSVLTAAPPPRGKWKPSPYGGYEPTSGPNLVAAFDNLTATLPGIPGYPNIVQMTAGRELQTDTPTFFIHDNAVWAQIPFQPPTNLENLIAAHQKTGWAEVTRDDYIAAEKQAARAATKRSRRRTPAKKAAA